GDDGRHSSAQLMQNPPVPPPFAPAAFAPSSCDQTPRRARHVDLRLRAGVLLAVSGATGLGVVSWRALEAQSPPTVRQVFARLPFSFEPNVGQAPHGIAFVARRGSEVF